MRTSHRHSLTAALVLLLALGSVAPAAARPTRGSSTAITAWAPAATATIHPGVQTVTNGGQCTANFIFTNGTDVLIGQAAHCSSNSAATSTDGCAQEAPPLPIGTQVEIQGASRPGTLVYSSWNAMIANGESDANTCAYNDFALVRVHPDDVAKVNPSLPAWGGPTGIGTSSTGESVYTYGNSSLRLGLTQLSPKTGVTLSAGGGGWTYSVYTVTPGIPGDSGSPVLNQDGQALGVLVTVALAPLAGSNGITDVGKAIAYARANGLSGLTLVNGTEAFDSSPLNLLPL